MNPLKNKNDGIIHIDNPNARTYAYGRKDLKSNPTILGKRNFVILDSSENNDTE